MHATWEEIARHRGRNCTLKGKRLHVEGEEKNGTDKFRFGERSPSPAINIIIPKQGVPCLMVTRLLLHCCTGIGGSMQVLV